MEKGAVKLQTDSKVLINEVWSQDMGEPMTFEIIDNP